MRIELPPLRARGSDVLLLAQHFLEHFAAAARQEASTGLSPPAAEKLLAYDWPGNVRELQNCIERAVALTRFDELTVDDLPEKIRELPQARTSSSPATIRPSSAAWTRSSAATSCACSRPCGGNKTLAARVLGLDRKTLYRKLERYGLATSEMPPSRPHS